MEKVGETLDFGAELKIALFEMGGQTIYLTETVINTWIIIAVMAFIALIIRIKSSKFKEVPDSKFQTAIEMIVDTLNGFVSSTMGGSSGKKFAAYFGPLIVFIAVCNLSGLLVFRPPTADFATTLAFALITFFMIHGFTLKKSLINRHRHTLTGKIFLKLSTLKFHISQNTLQIIILIIQQALNTTYQVTKP